MKKALLAIALVVSATGASFAQTAGQSVMGFLLAQGSTYGSFTCPSTATSPCFVQYGSSVPTAGSGGTVTPIPTNGTDTTHAITVGTSSAQALAASGATKYLFLQNVSTTANIACNFGGTAAINTAGSFMLPPNASRTFEGSFVPTTVLNCIASVASTPLTIETN